MLPTPPGLSCVRGLVGRDVCVLLGGSTSVGRHRSGHRTERRVFALGGSGASRVASPCVQQLRFIHSFTNLEIALQVKDKVQHQTRETAQTRTHAHAGHTNRGLPCKVPLTSACSHGDQNERVRLPTSKARRKSRPQAQGRRARAEQEREERGVRLCICHVGSRSVRVQEGCCAPTPHPSRAEEAGVLNRRLTQVCGARARREKALKAEAAESHLHSGA